MLYNKPCSSEHCFKSVHFLARKHVNIERSSHRNKPTAPSSTVGKTQDDTPPSNGFENRRRNAKFKSWSSDLKPLDDRGLKLRQTLANPTKGDAGGGDEVEAGSSGGLFDRFSTARRTLGRGSMRRNKNEMAFSEEDEDRERQKKRLSLDQRADATSSSGADWRSKLASKFKKVSHSLARVIRTVNATDPFHLLPDEQ